MEVLSSVGKQQAGDKSFIIDAHFLSTNWNARAIKVLCHSYYKRALLVIGRFDAEDPDAQLLHGALDIGKEAGQVILIGENIFAVLFTGFLASLEEDPVSILDPIIPDQDV